MYDDGSQEFRKLLDECKDNIPCTIKKIIDTESQQNSQFFFITTSNSSPLDIDTLPDQFYVKLVHLKAFSDQNLSENDKKQLELITELKQNNFNWAKIYQYQPTK
ncbi:hypothetical protein SDC9_107073 [bioreactor metagenome]|uniref:Uncharacterized protein n=1 Tax=bioreactor metagenome TaxID=1076179 RepID=A0A645B462_9ZZZZ